MSDLRQRVEKLKRPAGKHRRTLQQPWREKMMPFSPALAEKVVAGRSKGSFRMRLYPFYPRVGETFRARSNNAELPGLYRCRRIIRNITFRTLQQGRWREVGVNSPEEYQEILEDVCHREELDLEQPGFFFQFERLDDPGAQEAPAAGEV